jgi:hypothetical protein
MKLKTGDIMLTSRDSFIVKFMRWFQKDPVKYGHACVYVEESDSFLEAEWTIVETPYPKAMARKRYKNYVIYRYKDLTPQQAQRIVKIMRTLKGEIFSFRRLFLQMFDHIFNTNFFTKLSKNKKNQVCSSYVAWGYYSAIKIKFNNVPWSSCDPDDIDDHCSISPKWFKVMEV